MTVDDLIDEALSFLVAHPKSTRERLRDHLNRVISGYPDPAEGKHGPMLHPHPAGCLIGQITELSRAIAVWSHKRRVEAALDEVMDSVRGEGRRRRRRRRG